MTNNYMNPNTNAMTPNAMPADSSVQQFILPEMVDDSFSAEDIGEDFEGIRLSFRKVKIPGGGALQFEIPGDDPENPEEVPEIAIVVCIPNGFSGSSSAAAIEDIVTYYTEKKMAAAPENLVAINALVP